jgi:hypothetical protein
MQKNTPYSNKDTSALLRKKGFRARTLQTWNHIKRFRQDPFGFDVLAFRAGYGILAVQATTKTHLADHRRAMLDNPDLPPWLASGGRLHLWSWRKVGAAGSRQVWEPRIEEAFLQDGVVAFKVVDESSLDPKP